jgi:hypothetical protein
MAAKLDGIAGRLNGKAYRLDKMAVWINGRIKMEWLLG